MLYSFDVFDTLITRTTATPKGIFTLMQDKLNKGYIDGLSDYIKNNFYDLRVNSENVSHKGNTSEETSLERIYSCMATTGYLTDEQKKCLIELEIQTEIENSVAIPQNIEKLKKLIEDGNEVILISDMYLEKDILKKMLVNADSVFENVPLYCSSEYGKGKYTGNLFKLVHELKSVNYSDWVHIGDNVNSDVNIPIWLGINAEKYEFTELMPCEKHLLEKNENDSYTQLMIGAARNARLINTLSYPAQVGTSIGGGILFEYVMFIINCSIEMGLTRLYFIARDGYILQKIADKIIAKYNLNIKTYYIYGSRKAWRLASLNENFCDIELHLKWSHPEKSLTIEKYAKIFDMTADELLKYLPEEFSKGIALTNANQKKLAKHLNCNDDFKHALFQKNYRKRMLVQNYVKQEIDVSDDKFAFVELSGGGYTQICFAEFFDMPIKSFYFKLEELVQSDKCLFNTFIPCNFAYNLIIEPICRAPHGQTSGYARNENGKVVPVLNGEEKLFISHGYLDYVDGILKFTDEFLSVLPLTCRKISNVLEYMKYTALTPDKDLLEYIADVPNSETGRENEVVSFAPKLCREMLQDIFMYNYGRYFGIYDGSCFEYSILRCSAEDLEYIEYCKVHADDVSTYKKEICMLPDYIVGFPVEEFHGNIVVYGAGKFGTRVYKKLISMDYCNVVAWVDKAYQKYGEMVSDVENVLDVEFDTLVIAVLKLSVADEIRDELVRLGVDAGKIVWVDISSK